MATFQIPISLTNPLILYPHFLPTSLPSQLPHSSYVKKLYYHHPSPCVHGYHGHRGHGGGPHSRHTHNGKRPHGRNICYGEGRHGLGGAARGGAGGGSCSHPGLGGARQGTHRRGKKKKMQMGGKGSVFMKMGVSWA